MNSVSVTVRGNRGTYRVRFDRDDGAVATRCTCPAGRNGQWCSHRDGVLAGDADSVAGDPAVLVKLRELVSGSDLADALARRDAAILAGRPVPADVPAALRDACRGAPRRARVVVVRDIDGTGIQSGLIGEVIARQADGGPRAAEYATGMTQAAVLVRFTRASLGFKSGEPSRPPVGAELWLRLNETEPV